MQPSSCIGISESCSLQFRSSSETRVLWRLVSGKALRNAAKALPTTRLQAQGRKLGQLPERQCVRLFNRRPIRGKYREAIPRPRHLQLFRRGSPIVIEEKKPKVVVEDPVIRLSPDRPLIFRYRLVRALIWNAGLN